MLQIAKNQIIHVIYSSHSKFLHQLDVLIHASLRHTDFFRQFGRRASTLYTDEMVDSIESLEDLFLHKIRFG